ncbi:MAG: hypothetical protein IIA07_13645 [Proteobacteria bacterium]|nr:hypothetical protein [Pseudomonadota bacterium]
MAEQHDNVVTIEPIDNLSIVTLKIAGNSIESASDKLQLAPPVTASGSDPRSLWFGPDRWLLISSSLSADSMVKTCEEALADVLHNAGDYSAGLAVFRVAGPGARDLLASGCGIDFRAKKFPVDSCCRTRFSQIAAIIVAQGPEEFDIYVDRSYGVYLNDWLRESLSIAASANLLGTG